MGILIMFLHKFANIYKMFLFCIRKMRCKVCLADAKYKCGKCSFANYCSARCQQQDWSVHQKNCKYIGMPKRGRDGIKEKREQIARKEKEVKQLQKEVEQLIKEERNTPSENPLSQEEEEKLKGYLWTLSVSDPTPPWEKKWKLPPDGSIEEYYAEVEIVTPENFATKEKSFKLVWIAGHETVLEKISQGPLSDDNLKEVARENYKENAEVETIAFPPPADIVDLMQRARVTLVVEPKKYSVVAYDVRGDPDYDEQWQDAGESIEWGYIL